MKVNSFLMTQYAGVCKVPKAKKTTKRKKAENVPSSVALSILRVAAILAAVDGVYKSEEKKKIREVAKLFPSLRIAQSGLLELDGDAERIAKLFAKGGSVADAFSESKTGVDVEACFLGIAENPAWVYPAVLVWLSICCCDSDYCAMERKVMTKICCILSKDYNIVVSENFIRKAEIHLHNLAYAEGCKSEIKDSFRVENLKDVIEFEKGLLTRMAAGKEF